MRKGRGWSLRGRSRGRKRVGDPSDPKGFAALLTRYLEWMRSRNYAETTVAAREKALQFLIEWAELRGITRPGEVTKPVLERYQRHLFHYRKANGRPLSFVSQYSRLVAVRMFFRWLARHNYVLWNPASDLELPRLEKRLPRAVLTAGEADRVMEAVNLKNVMGVRDRAILETLYSTGMRRAELIGLKLVDLDPERGTLVIRQGKGKKDRMVPIGERAVHWIERYLEDLRPKLAGGGDAEGGGLVFLNDSGQSFTRGRLTQLVRKCVDRAELGKTGACHLFRHTMATLMHENGADIRFIQKMLGHQSLETTQIYTQVSIRKLKEIHAATHPARLERPAQDGAGDGTAEGADEQRRELLASLAAEEEDDNDDQEEAGDDGEA